jgi:hypothetical protein
MLSPILASGLAVGMTALFCFNPGCDSYVLRRLPLLLHFALLRVPVAPVPGGLTLCGMHLPDPAHLL